MKDGVTLAALMALVPAHGTAAPVRSGQATAELIQASSTYQPDKPVEAAVRMKIDPDWHGYWVNPGSGGMKPNLEWTLPEGWKAEVRWPVPVRFKTGDLPGFGYVGELVVPVTFRPPATFTGTAVVRLQFDWLTCNEDACIPGDMKAEITLKPGETSPTPEAPVIAAAADKTPRAVEGLALEVRQEDKHLVLSLKAPVGVDPAKFEAFPATPQVIDPGAKFAFIRSGDSWTARVPASEYLAGEPTRLELVLTGGGLKSPADVSWVKK